MDRLRQLDTRWGYNAKPTRTAADNGGVPVVAAGDEILYNWGSNADEGNTSEVYAVDILEQPTAATRVATWRVFTGEEPVRWTGAGASDGRLGPGARRLRAAANGPATSRLFSYARRRPLKHRGRRDRRRASSCPGPEPRP